MMSALPPKADIPFYVGDCHQVAEALAADLVDVDVAHPTALEMSQPCIGLGGGSAQAAALLASATDNTVMVRGAALPHGRRDARHGHSSGDVQLRLDFGESRISLILTSTQPMGG